MNLRDAELTQYLKPTGFGPSGNTWPRWESARALRTSTRFMPRLSSARSTTLPGAIGFAKLGQPVPLSNLSRELKSGSPETTST